MLSIIGPVFYLYAVVLLVGGVYGYVKSKSSISLVVGIMSAILAAVAALLVPRSPLTGVGLGTILALALGVVFFLRFRTTKNPMPALPMIALSGAVLILGLIALGGLHAAAR